MMALVFWAQIGKLIKKTTNINFFAYIVSPFVCTELKTLVGYY